MNFFNSKGRKLFLICMVTTFMGQIYVNPFSSDFRFSLSVVTFTLFMYWYQELKIIPVSLVTGLFLLVFRVLIQYSQPWTESILALAGIHYPVVIYYFVLGFFLQIFNFRRLYQQKFIFVALISFSDALANLIEILLRPESTIRQTFFAILFVGVIRGCMTLLVLEAIKYYEMLLVKEQHEERYKQLILLTSNLKSEVFFLKKSMEDMEAAMVKSYRLYDQLKELHQRELKDMAFSALSVARDIHEIKKDYLRVAAGLEKVMPEIEAHGGMALKDIFNVIESSFKKSITGLNKGIRLQFKLGENVFIKNAYELISIINNLIINAIEAVPIEGEVQVGARLHGENLEIIVRDNGEGIEPDSLRIIFEAGYTTKFDQDTGKMNTGIGLTHVQHLVVDQFNGKIDVMCDPGEGTSFKVELPMTNL